MEFFLLKVLAKVAISVLLNDGTSATPRDDSGADTIDGGIDLFF